MFPEFFQSNYDYGENVYSKMDKYKSVGDFLADSRKKLKARKKKYKTRKKVLNKLASYLEFTDQYDYVEQNGDFAHGLADIITPLPDEDGKDVTVQNHGFDIFPKEDRNDEEEVITIDFPYTGSENEKGEGVDKEFLDNIQTKENEYYKMQNEGRNMYFFVGSIPNSLDIFKGSK